MKGAVLVVVSSLLFHGCLPPPAKFLNLQRPLTPVEMDIVVKGIHTALTGTTLRLVQERRVDDREVLMGPGGIPRMIRGTHTAVGVSPDGELIAGIIGGIPGGGGISMGVPRTFVSLIEYTGHAAPRCDDAPATGEMVVEYLLDVAAQTWTVTARESRPGEREPVHPLEMLKTPASLRSGEGRLVHTRIARAIVFKTPFDAAHPHITGDPAPNPAEFVPVQTLWIDTNSLLPLRWEVTQRDAIVAAYDFVYERLDFQRPAGIEVPVCVSR